MPLLTIPLIALIINELIKVTIETIKQKKFSWRFFGRPGGMPSGHSAFTAALITLAWQTKGLDSFELAGSIVFGVIVMYDALHLRAEVGKQAQILNSLQKNVRLEERAGHTIWEVMVGAIVGGATVWLWFNFLPLS
jgi:hypothetical protein